MREQARQYASFNTLQGLLCHAAETAPKAGLVIYPKHNPSEPIRVSYENLLIEAQQLSATLRLLDDFVEGHPILLHFNDHWNSVLWYWAVLFAGCLPVLSSPFSNSSKHRLDHMQGLGELLESPICITKAELLHLFGDCHNIRAHPIESLQCGYPRHFPKAETSREMYHLNDSYSSSQPAILMLTSGSTGNPKAVPLLHNQILASLKGKAAVRQLQPDRPFLNWIGLDHVAGLIEIHLQALYLAVDQIHIHGDDIVSSPRLFLDLLSSHRVTRSFAPNFFLARLVSTSKRLSLAPDEWDFSDLRVLGSGGESNDTETCVFLSRFLSKYGAPQDVIMPGFGMTETCAGSIYNLQCPAIDVSKHRSTVAVGKCIEGVEMRVTLPMGNKDSILAPLRKPGNLEVRGNVVFQGYYRNTAATAEVFTSDGWFRTGDQAFIDLGGNLNLVGREKDVININGVKIGCEYVKNSLEQLLGNCVRRMVAFPSQSTQHSTEQITVAFVPQKGDMSAKNLTWIRHRVIENCLLMTGSSPFVFPLPDESILPISTIGKISTRKMKAMFEEHMFDDCIKYGRETTRSLLTQHETVPATNTETQLLEQVSQVLGIDPRTIGVDFPLLDLGFTSMNLIQLKHLIENHVDFQVPIITIMKNPTIKHLAAALDELHCRHAATSILSPPRVPYNPVVTLRARGNKTPLWLIHPGVGEVLVFVGLAQHLADDDRPVYALRARGFECDQERFESISEAVQAYHDAILYHQPNGPYAIAGYSYGSMLAFEVAKKIESKGLEASVRFLGCFNLPPHIKSRMRQLNWNSCLIHLAYFLSLIDESEAERLEESVGSTSRAEAMTRLMGSVDGHRMKELGMGEKHLKAWAEVAFGLQSMAVDYEPHGQVSGMDIFYAVPLRAVATNMEEWLHNHLGQWRDYCKSEPSFHFANGAHYTMIGPDHVKSFSQILKRALRARDL